jgi:hypothetical protein
MESFESVEAMLAWPAFHRKQTKGKLLAKALLGDLI